jgi:hypothetical protein
VALGASGRIDSAAGSRRLLDRCEAGASAGGALAFNRVRFRLFHVRSQNDKFLLPSLQIEARDLKDFGNPGEANNTSDRAPRIFALQLSPARFVPISRQIL